MAVYDYFGNVMKEGGSAQRAYTAANLVNGVLTGGALNDAFSVAGATTMAGGAGDDRYYSVTFATKIIEKPGGGIDTVYLSDSYVMPDNVENAYVGYGNGVVGNALANIIVGSASAQSIDGGQGNDVLTGGGGGDSFVFSAKSGYDVITDFHAGPSSVATVASDTIRLNGYSNFKSFADVQKAMTQVGSDTIIKLDASDSIKLLNVQESSLTSDNFLLTLDRSHLVQTFDDEFNSLSLWNGQNGGTWRSDYGWGGDRNNPLARTLAGTGEKELYVDTSLLKKGSASDTLGINPFSVDDGILTIHAAPTPTDEVADAWGYKYTSGLLSTRNSFTQTYGYFEARMELPAGSGAWPAFWLYSTNGSGSELDTMESHTSDLWGATTHDPTGTISSAVFTPDLSTGYHTYGVLWTDKTVTWYLDGVAVRSEATPSAMHGPMYMIVNLAVDSSVASSFTGADLKVDYVRAYALDNLPDSLTHTVTGTTGADYLSGTTAADTLIGGAGKDTYYVDNAGDKVVENPGEGTDTVHAAVDYTLPANVENLVLVGSAIHGTGNELDNVITGNALNNVLSGGAGNDTIDGGAGADTMIGGTGNDTYYVDNAGDTIVENAGEGADTVIASVDYTLPANVENLTLTGSAVNGTGNALDNVITGNALNNVLSGGAGNDKLVGGAGADTMIGGTGDDTYIVDNANDVVVEKAGEGFDRVYASVDYTAPANVEALTLQGSATKATANDTGDYLYGNGNGDVLTGGAGNDRIFGGAGNDRIIGGAGNDGLSGGAGNDTFVFAPGFGKDIIEDFTIGQDSIDWSALVATYGKPKIADVAGVAVATFGADTITFKGLTSAQLIAANVFDPAHAGGPAPLGQIFTGTLGNDTFTVTSTLDQVIELPNGGIDTINASVDYTLPADVENLTLTGSAINGTGNALDNVITGNGLADTLSGGAGNDTLVDGGGVSTLIGGTGNDTYYVNNAGDKVVEKAGEGTDTVIASIDYTLPVNVENLTLVGNAIHATGNALDNVITGNALDNVIDGGAGADTMIGGTGNDTYYVDNAGDKVVENAGEGTDTVIASIDYTLAANVENLTLVGNAIHATGNALANVITGNAFDNVIDGGAGADTMIGGTGNDTYYVDNAGDKVVENAGEGTDTIYSSVDYTAAANVEVLYLTGNATKATANDTGTFLYGNDKGDVLTGGTGNDHIYGGAGADHIVAGAGNDDLTGGAGSDTFVFGASLGKDVIEDFKIGEDSIDWSALAKTYGNPTVADVGGVAVATFGSNSITFKGVTTAQLASAHLLGLGQVETAPVSTPATAPVTAPSPASHIITGTSGNDNFYVHSALDQVVESPGGGIDTVWSTIDYTLPANVEKLVLQGTAINGTGNDLDNTITGNALNDVLSGGAGNDLLFAGAGADTLIGGTGNDSYTVNSAKDVVIEKPGEGWDQIFSSVDYSAPDNIEQLVLTGNAIRGTANQTGMTMIGNAADNILTGGAGKDQIAGGAGNDTINGGGGDDYLAGGAGNDTFVFAKSFGHDTITDFNVNQDHIDWSALTAGGAPTMKMVGANAVVSFGQDNITFLGVSVSDLQSHHVFG